MSGDLRVYKCRSIVKGSGKGEAIVSKAAMCFYLIDPKSGVVIERNHPLQGKSVAGKILVVSSGKGSSVVQLDGFYQLWVKDNLPAAIIVAEAEPVIVSSAVVVGKTMVDKMETDPFEAIEDGDYVEVDADAGEVRVRKKG
jgi:predicted aconitase with swiveling domain